MYSRNSGYFFMHCENCEYLKEIKTRNNINLKK